MGAALLDAAGTAAQVPSRLPAACKTPTLARPFSCPFLQAMYHLDTGAANEHVPMNDQGFYLSFWQVRRPGGGGCEA